jgi:hypothetical protein
METVGKIIRFGVFIVGGIVMFPAWVLVLTLHGPWIDLIKK